MFVMLALGLEKRVPQPKFAMRLLLKLRFAQPNARGALLGLLTPLIPCGPLYLMLGIALVAGWMTGTLIQFTFLVLTALLAISCGLTLPLRVWLFAWPLAKLAAVLPLTQG